MKKSFFLVLAILWMAIIWLLSSIPNPGLPSANIIGIDKLAHWGEYFIWGMLVNQYLRYLKYGKRGYWLVFLIMLLCAALDEYHQKYIPGRSVSIYDFVANALGLLSALYSGLRMLKKLES